MAGKIEPPSRSSDAAGKALLREQHGRKLTRAIVAFVHRAIGSRTAAVVVIGGTCEPVNRVDHLHGLRRRPRDAGAHPPRPTDDETPFLCVPARWRPPCGSA